MLHTVGLVLCSTAFIVLMYAPLERMFPARKQSLLRRSEVWLDVCFFLGQQLVWGGLSVSALLVLRRGLGGDALGAVTRGFRAQPWLLQAILVVVLGDLLVYCWHRACHRYALLWRFHSAHHSAESLDWLAAFREHPVDGITTQLMQNLPAFLLGFPLLTIAGIATFRGAWAIFVHSNTRLRLGPFALLFGAPELHHYHHARVTQTKHNFANLAPWIDVLFGTYHRPTTDDYELGLPTPSPKSYWGQLVAPFRHAPQVGSGPSPRRSTVSER